MDNSITAEDEVKPVTHWLCVDLSKENGVLLLQQAIRYLVSFHFFGFSSVAMLVKGA